MAMAFAGHLLLQMDRAAAHPLLLHLRTPTGLQRIVGSVSNFNNYDPWPKPVERRKNFKFGQRPIPVGCHQFDHVDLAARNIVTDKGQLHQSTPAKLVNGTGIGYPLIDSTIAELQALALLSESWLFPNLKSTNFGMYQM